MLIIDRFEGAYAVVEDSGEDKMIQIKRELIDKTVAEGDVIVLSDGTYHVDSEATKKRRAEVLALLKKMDLKNK